MHVLTLRPRKHRAAHDAMTIGVLLVLAAIGCSNAFEPPPGTPHMSGTWKGAATNVTLTVNLGSVQDCNGFCVSDSGPITGGSYADATLNAHGSILADGYYIVIPCYGAPRRRRISRIGQSSCIPPSRIL